MSRSVDLASQAWARIESAPLGTDPVRIIADAIDRALNDRPVVLSVRPHELAKRLGIEASVASKRLERLHAAGLLTRVRHGVYRVREGSSRLWALRGLTPAEVLGTPAPTIEARSA